MLCVQFRALLSDQSTQSRWLDIGRTRGGSVADYIVVERADSGDAVNRSDLLGYPRWTEHVSGLAARCAPALWHPDRIAHSSTEQRVEAAWVDIGLGSQLHGMRKRLERVEYVRTGFAPRVRVAREHWPSYEHPAPAELPAGASTVIALLALAAWGSTDVPKVPNALDVPVSETCNGMPVVRFLDIPEPARRAFDRWMDGATIPSLDSAYAWDWTRFIEGA